jgi:hypothetical protein
MTNESLRARLERVERENAAMKQTLHRIRREPFGAEEALDALDDELGESTTTPITLAGIERGDFSDDELVARMDEVKAVMSGNPIAGTEPLTMEDIAAHRYSDEELADRGDELRALMEAQ